MNSEEIWWRRVPSAAACVREAKEALQGWKSVVISSEAGIREEVFCGEVLRAVQEEDYSVAVYELDLMTLNAGETIMDGIAEQLGIGYMMQRTVANLAPELPESGSIWVLRHVDNNRWEEFQKLLKHIQQEKTRLAFVLSRNSPAKQKGAHIVSLSPSRLDLQYYAWTLLIGRIPEYLLEYASQMAVALSGDMPERCALLCKEIWRYLKSPEDASAWMPENILGSKVQTAQVRVIQPCIEYGRMYLVQKLEKRIRAVLPFTDEYGTKFSKPVEVELRNLVYFRDRQRLNMTDQESNLLDRLYRARNKLSHLEQLTYEEAETILLSAGEWERDA